MGDLISRQKLIQMIDNDILATLKWIDSYEKATDIHKPKLRELKSQLTTLKTYREIVKDMPTAYNVDKVVEQLEKATVIGADCVGKGFECIPTYKAIEIVKGGGVDE